MAPATVVDTLPSAVARFRAGDLDEAERNADAVLRGDPRSGDALALRGLIAYERGDFEASATWHLRAIAARRREPLYYCNLATACSAQGALTRAQGCYEKALKLRPDHPEAIAGLADVLERRGNPAEAETLLAPLVVRGDAAPRAIVTLGRVLLRGERLEELVALVRRHLDVARLPGPTRRSLLFLLGHAHDRLDDPDAAFECFRDANAIDACPFDPARHAEKHATLRRVFSARALAALPATREATRLPVLVVGMPRCGSTLVEQIVQAHPAGGAAGECPDLAAMLAAMPAVTRSDQPYPFCVHALDAAGATRLVASYVAALERRHPDAQRIVDKTLVNYERLGLVAGLMPDARIVHVRRSPLDVGLSCFMHDLSPRLHPWSTTLEGIGRYHAEYETLMEHWRGSGAVDMLEVAYEDLVADPEPHVRRLVDHLGLPWDDRCLRPDAVRRDVATISYDQVHRPISTSAVGRHRRYEDHLAPLRRALDRGTP
jgi:Flp pilus assembly protein TadD